MMQTGAHQSAHNGRRFRLFAVVSLPLLFLGLLQADQPAPVGFDQRFEINFMKGGMIDHHNMARLMSDMCLQKNVRQELKGLCQQITTDQQREITEMQGWLQSWYGLSYSPVMDRSGQEMMQRLNSLDGDAFSRLYLQMMILHHWQAIAMAGPCVDRTWHDELHYTCQNIIRSQVRESEQMQTWLQQWHDIAEFRPRGRAHSQPMP